MFKKIILLEIGKRNSPLWNSVETYLSKNYNLDLNKIFINNNTVGIETKWDSLDQLKVNRKDSISQIVKNKISNRR